MLPTISPDRSGADLVLAAETEQIVLRIEPHRTVKDQRNELSGLERVDPERTGAVLGKRITARRSHAAEFEPLTGLPHLRVLKFSIAVESVPEG